MIQNRTKRIWKNVINETAIQAANFLWSIHLLILRDTLLLRPSLHLSTLHFFPFKLHPSTLRNLLIWLNPIYISYHCISPLLRIELCKIYTYAFLRFESLKAISGTNIWKYRNEINKDSSWFRVPRM